MLSREERQFIYNWFNTMLARELSDAQLAQLQAVQFTEFFAFFAELGFEQEIAKFQAEITACSAFEFPRLELAADFAQLFLLEGNVSAIPYSSAYLHDEALNENLAEMDRLLNSFSLQVNNEQSEPSDHICVYLSLLTHLIASSSETEQLNFIQQNIMSWLPTWVEKAKRVSSKTAFYQTFLALFVAFIHFDLKMLGKQ